jgi:hypothetical protein
MSSGGSGRPNKTEDDANANTNTTNRPLTTGGHTGSLGSTPRRINTAHGNTPKGPQFSGTMNRAHGHGHGHKGQTQGGGHGSSNIPTLSKVGGKPPMTKQDHTTRNNVLSLKKIENTSNNVVEVRKGGCDHETERYRSLYRTTSPLFQVKSDDELDKNLKIALEQSAKLGGSEHVVVSMSPPSDTDTNRGGNTTTMTTTGTEFIVCDGHPPEWKLYLDNNVLCDCTIQSNDGKVCVYSQILTFPIIQ